MKHEPAERAEEDLEALARAVLLATLYSEDRRARRWLDQHQDRRSSRGCLTTQESETYNVIRLAVELGAKRREEADRLYAAIDWRKPYRAAWVRNIRLRLAVNHNSKAEVVDALRRSACDKSRTPLKDRATCLIYLGDYFFGRGDLRRAEALYGTAHRLVSERDSFDFKITAAAAKVSLGLTAFLQNNLVEARQLLTAASADLQRHGLKELELRAKTNCAIVFMLLDDPTRAEELLLQIVAFWRSDVKCRAATSGLAMVAYQLLSQVYVARQELSNASACIRSATRVLRYCDTPRYRGHYHALKAVVLGHSARPATVRRAFLELDRAEACYGQLGDGYTWGLGWVRRLRGELHLRQRQAPEALEAASSCCSPARKGMEALLEDQTLLLKSRILLLEDVPRPDRLYEDVLSNLGLARNPVTLFKVVANLYLYSWELHDDLELTDYHLRQVNRMADHLDRPTFERLYTKHVTQPVVRRAMERTFGVKIFSEN